MAGRYRLERKLGQGGMGTVFAATDLSLKRTVALKLLRPEASNDDDSLSRFALEARAVASIGHPHIGALFDFHAQRDPVPFLVMELIEGESLRALLARERAISPQRAVHIARQMLAALSAAHAGGTVHRDIKPTNVMIVRSAAVPDLVKLVDFGVAKMADSVTRAHHTEGGMLLGTPQYMAPEQAAGLPVGPSADVYAVGVCLFEMIAGYNPFAVGELGVVLASIRDVVPPSLAQIRGDVPPMLAQIVARALAKFPNARFGSAEELSNALASFGAPSGSWVDAAATVSGPVTSATVRAAPATLAAPPSLGGAGHSVASYVNPGLVAPIAPAPRSSGVFLGAVIGALVVVTLVAVGLAGVLFLRDRNAAETPVASAPAAGSASSAGASSSKGAGIAAIPSAPDASHPAQAKSASAPSKPPAKPAARGDCLCLPINANPDTQSLCIALDPPSCRCSTSSTSPPMCLQPFTKCVGTCSEAYTCPDANYKALHHVAGAVPFAACQGYYPAWDRDVPTGVRETGTWECNLCTNPRVYPGPQGEPCKGFHSQSGKPYDGRMYCD